MANGVEEELRQATDRILKSENRKKLVVAGPGTGKTFLFRKLLEQSAKQRDDHLVLTFINNLKNDLDRSLGERAQVYTLHGYCQHLLYQNQGLRGGLTGNFKCYPGLVSLIKQDWSWLRGINPPEFVKEMRNLDCSEDHEGFYFSRTDYYDAVDFDDSVYKTYRKLLSKPDLMPPYELVLIDEFQDFNKMEAGVIGLLASNNPIVIAGDDDQALYSQLRGASWDHIRAHHADSEYEVFELPFCMRCTEVIVDAINDIITQARALAKLDGRIDKPYRFYEPHKGGDSRHYPQIDLVRTSVQRTNANYFGRYIEEAIRSIPEADIEKAHADNEPAVLIIGRRPYLPQIQNYLIDAGLLAPEDDQTQSEQEKALELLHEDNASNLGWRIILGCEDHNTAAKLVRAADEQGVALVEVIPVDKRKSVLQDAREFVAAKVAAEANGTEASDGNSIIKLTSFEGSKGLSAQYVFLVGVHEGEIPRNSDNIQDIEICRFLVGLTRTKKRCSILITNNFGGETKRPSPFLEWIDSARFQEIEVNARYWGQS